MQILTKDELLKWYELVTSDIQDDGYHDNEKKEAIQLNFKVMELASSVHNSHMLEK